MSAEDGRELERVGDFAVPRRLSGSQEAGGGCPRVEMTVEVVDGEPRCTGLSMTGILDAWHLSDFNLHALIRSAFAQAAMKVDDDNPGMLMVGAFLPEATETVDAWVTRPKRRTRDDVDYLREVATLYRANPTAPAKAIRERFGVSDKTATNHARWAHEAGLLDELSMGGRPPADNATAGDSVAPSKLTRRIGGNRTIPLGEAREFFDRINREGQDG